MTLIELQHQLRDAIGLDTASIGTPAFERAVRSRVAATCGELAKYPAYIKETPTELQELIEAVVVSETWFFRDGAAFTTMVRMLRERPIWTNPTRVLRILSLPCSTGEEPYSIAMSLLSAKLPAERFQIDAVDVSVQALSEAERGVYRKNSFRGKDLAFRARYFVAQENGHRISETVRTRVRFAKANPLDPAFMAGCESYDVVFCRNLLIYFDDAARKTTVAALHRLLKEDGILFVGPSEAGLMLDHGFIPMRVPLAFAFQKATAANLKTVAPTIEPVAVPPVHPRRIRQRAEGPARRHPAMPRQQIGNLALDLEGIRRIADQGQLEEAAQAGEAYLRATQPSPEILLLLGLVRDAAGDPGKAADYYRKALYLDPNHAEALLHLALLLTRQGDIAGAKVMNDRLRRLDQPGNG